MPHMRLRTILQTTVKRVTTVSSGLRKRAAERETRVRTASAT